MMIIHLNGLRAIAIIMVLLFHCFPLFKNGFLGVDIFLVISGYLLFRKFWTDDAAIDIGQFIAKKIARLFPLAAVVSLICCVVALCVFPYDLTVRTAKSALATLIGCSNIYYDYIFSDYFSSSTRLNPLIHTWYLSVTAQIYLIYIVISFVSHRKSKRFKFLLLLQLSIVSFVVYYSPLWLPKVTYSIWPHSTYYWVSGRLWMVCAGAFAHLLPCAKERRAVIAFSSLLLIVGMGFSYHGFGPRGTMALEVMTVICSALVVMFGNAQVCAFILCRPLLQVIGRYSFSLYIIHWPIIVFCSYIASAYDWHEQVSVQLAEMVLSLLLACVIYHGFEQRKYTLRQCACFTFIVVAGSCMLILTEGMRDYLHPVSNSVHVISYSSAGQSRPIESGPLYNSLPDFRQVTHRVGHGSHQNWGESVPLLYEIGSHQDKANFLLMGDSHAESLYPGLDVMAKKMGWNGVYLHTYVIPVVDMFSKGGLPYQRWDRKKSESLFLYLADNPQINTVLLANFWKTRFKNSYVNWAGKSVTLSPQEMKNYHCMRDFLVRLRSLGKKVVIFTDVPDMPEHSVQGYIRRQLLYEQPVDESRLLCSQESYDKDNREINDVLKRWEGENLCVVMHPESVLFQEGKAHCFVDGKLLYMDGDHLSLEGSIRCIQSLAPSLETLLKAEDNH